MKTFILLRHAHAEKNSHKKDFFRNLEPKGIRVANLMSHKLKKHIPIIDLMISSTATRAKETAKIFQTKAFHSTPIQLEKDLYYLQFSNLFFDFVYRLDESLDTVIFVGHNPIFTFLAQSLSDNSNLYMYPASFLIVNFNKKKWTEVNSGTVKNTIYESSQKT